MDDTVFTMSSDVQQPSFKFFLVKWNKVRLSYINPNRAAEPWSTVLYWKAVLTNLFNIFQPQATLSTRLKLSSNHYDYNLAALACYNHELFWANCSDTWKKPYPLDPRPTPVPYRTNISTEDIPPHCPDTLNSMTLTVPSIVIGRVYLKGLGNVLPYVQMASYHTEKKLSNN